MLCLREHKAMTLIEQRSPIRVTAKPEAAIPDIATTRPGTPGGIFMRQFWHALYRSQDLPLGHAKPIRIRIEDDAIRCVYHGWKFDSCGQCVDQPAEEVSFARKVQLRTYPTREYLGLIFGYFGPGEPPPFPHFPHR